MNMSIIARFASGLAGWLTFEDMRRKSIHHDEATLYGPLVDIAESSGFRVKREFPLPRAEGQRGSPKEIDLVVGNPKTGEFAAVEIKFKKTAKAMAGSIATDAEKLGLIDGETINIVRKQKDLLLPPFGAKSKLDHAVLVVWRQGDIVSAIRKKEPAIIQRQFLTLMKAMHPEPEKVKARDLAEAFFLNHAIKPVNVKAGHVRWGSTWTHDRYWIAALRRRPSWSEL